jgi:SSS family solute:Na+ symporter
VSLHILDILTLALYFGVIAWMGWYFSQRSVSTEKYFVGGRSFPGWAIGLSLVGTSISSVTFLAFPADAYKTAWIRFLPSLMLPLGVAIAAFYFLPFFRRGRVTSAYEYLEWRFGPGIRVYGALTFILGQLTRLSLILYLVSLLIYEISGLHPILCILIGGVFVAGYTIIGGIEAVIWTDVVQTIVLALGGIACIVVIIWSLPGGLMEILEVATREHKLSFRDLEGGELRPIGWGFSLQEKTGSMMLLMGLMLWLTEYSANQNTVQRYAASRSTREARKAMLICVLASVPIWAFFMFLGTSLYVYFEAFPSTEAAEMLSGARKAEQIFPYFIINFLPPGLSGFLIAAALAAAMSSLDSSINAISTVSIVDIYRRHLVKGRDDLHYLRAAFGFAALASIIMILGAIALAVTDSKTLQDTGTIIGSLVAGGLLGMYLLGFLTRRGDARSVGCGIVATMSFTGWTLLVQFAPGVLPGWARAPFDLYYTIIIGNVIMFCTGYFVSFLLPTRKRDFTNLTVWDQDWSTPLD